MATAPDFARILSEYEERIVRYLTHLLGDPSLARDLSQETFLRVHQGLDQLRSPEARTGWIYRIASNLALDHFRSRAAREEGRTMSLDAERLDEAAPEIPDELSAEGRLEQEEMAECLRHYIQHLPGPYRVCLILRDLEGLGEEATAEILGSSVAAVKVRTHRARRQLREALRQACRFYQDERGIFRCEPTETLDEGRT